MAEIDEEVKAEFMTNKHRFIANLVFTSNWFRNLVVEYLKPYNISFQQFNFLKISKGAKDWMLMSDFKKLPNVTQFNH